MRMAMEVAMTVPMIYESLTPEEKAWVCNGAGPKNGPDVPDFIFTEAANRHDFDYWLGFSDQDRARADNRFLDNMLAKAKTQAGWWARQWYTVVAWRYYSAVRWLGRPAFSFRERYATHEDLVREMALDP